MRRVLANLVHNAAEAMTGRPGAPPGTPCPHPKILVETRISAHRVEISIRDNGPGMTADILARVKEPLFTTKNFGTGLGLPAVERILELHGGGLDIRSEPGAGATFTAWFPMQQPAAVQAA